MILRDVGLDVDRVLCTEREPGVQQCTFIFEFDDESEAIYIRGASYSLLFVNRANVVLHIPK